MPRVARRPRRLSRQQIILVVILACIVGFLADFGSLILKARNLDEQAVVYEKQKKQLNDEYADLQSRLKYVRSDEYILATAPDLLLWGPPGARFVIPENTLSTP